MRNPMREYLSLNNWLKKENFKHWIVHALHRPNVFSFILSLSSKIDHFVALDWSQEAQREREKEVVYERMYIYGSLITCAY